jgi:hypothetical protein
MSSTIHIRQDLEALGAEVIRWRWVPMREAEALPAQPQAAASNILLLRLAVSYRILSCTQVRVRPTPSVITWLRRGAERWQLIDRRPKHAPGACR